MGSMFGRGSIDRLLRWNEVDSFGGKDQLLNGYIAAAAMECRALVFDRISVDELSRADSLSRLSGWSPK